MANFLNKWKSGSALSTPSLKDGVKKKDESTPEMTPLEKMLQNAGAIRPDGSDKFYGMENFGNTCYCNSIVQALFYTTAFREQVLNFPPQSPLDTPNGSRPKVNVHIRAPNTNGNAQTDGNGKSNTNGKGTSTSSSPQPGQPVRPEDKPDTPEYKKKQAMLKGPILELAQESKNTYGMEEGTFTGLRDIFMALVESNTRTGVLSPQRFLEIFKRDNEMFRNSMHQDAHEFYGLVLNDVIANVESTAQRLLNRSVENGADGMTQSLRTALGAVAKTTPNGTNSPGTGWVHDIFEGLLTSETRCLTCERASQRDETFLDLSIDLEEHTSVTSCLQKFSAEEMLCERNKFHCDHCGGLQEAEKRMKLKRLPKVLALHLKRFKYTEDYSRLQKLFHRVVYPYQLRMFNTTEDIEDPDRLYELYAVVIHIGGNAYHGHYVSVIKTEDRGWLLFDDEMVEPVDKHYVRNFFGDKPGMACAYVLFYQETTFEKVRAEQEAEGLEEVRIVSEKADVAQENGKLNGQTNGHPRRASLPVRPADERNTLANLEHASTTPDPPPAPTSPLSVSVPIPPTPEDIPPVPPLPSTARSKSIRDTKKEAKAQEKAQEKARKQAEKDESYARRRRPDEAYARLRDARKQEQIDMRKAMEESKKAAPEETQGQNEEKDSVPALSRGHRGSKSMSRKSFGFLRGKRDSMEALEGGRKGSQDMGHRSSQDGGQTSESASRTPMQDRPEPFRLRKSFSFGIGRKKSTKVPTS
ncbi:cysteine proteinase [Xylaria sp. CBS 124048]|nr:cysteine proteinase [Xylaria sp. CBS 124048]